MTGPRICRRSRGIASIVGMLFLVVIFMLAVGTQVYLSGVQAQSSESAQQAQVVLGDHNREEVEVSSSASGVKATDSGTASVSLVAMVLKFENGTVYDLSARSAPAFSPSVIPPEGSLEVQSLVPAGNCSPGTATCMSKYESIVGGSPVPGRGVGLVTSLGNVFWYAPSAASSGQGAAFYRTTAVQSTTSPTWVPVTGLSFAGPPGSFYAVQVYVSYWQSSSANPAIAFGISVTSGATFLFCGGLSWANAYQATTDFPQGNLCTGAPDTSLGPTYNTQTWCTTPTGACELVGTAFVSFGSNGGSFQLEFKGASTDTASVAAVSVIAVSS